MAYAFGAIVRGKQECNNQMFENSLHNKGLEFRVHQRAGFELVAPLKIRCADKHLRHEGLAERSSLYLAPAPTRCRWLRRLQINPAQDNGPCTKPLPG
jgi:hypothetical protein